jgi:gamma-glutamylputrescine oxidase
MPRRHALRKIGLATSLGRRQADGPEWRRDEGERSVVQEAGHVDSYYAASARGLVEHPQLEGRIDTEVCIIGGGFTGVSALLHLAELGRDAVLIEAKRIGSGASGRNGGQVGRGQRVDQPTLERWFGEARARQLWQLAEEAKATVEARIARHGIDCDLRPGILTAAHDAGEALGLHRLAGHLADRYDDPHVRFVTRDEMAEMLGTERYFGGLLDPAGCHLHPLNYLLGLAKAARDAGGRILEHSRALAIEEGAEPLVTAASGQIRASHVVLATNGYLGGLMPDLAGWIMPIDNFIVATAPLGEGLARSLIPGDVAVADTKFVIDYFRLSADHRLLFGGGESYGGPPPADVAALVRKPMLRVFPQLADVPIDHAWHGTLAITRNRLPHFARIGSNIHVAHGYSGHGIAMATLAGKLIAEAIEGDTGRFDLMADLGVHRFPGGHWLRRPALIAGTLYYRLRDRL